MPQRVILLISLCLVFSKIVCAEPWFTGPIFAGAADTIPKGHTNFEVYNQDTIFNGRYNQIASVDSLPLNTDMVLPILSHGFTDWMDVQIATPYLFNSVKGENYNHIGDTSLGIGIQLLEQKKQRYLPDLRLFIQETIPTGKYEQLNPTRLSSDSTGLGSYITAFNLNFGYLAKVFNSHYLRTRFVLNKNFYSSVPVIGFNSFGGSAITDGTANLGTYSIIDLAFEYTLTQNWVAVLEGYYSYGSAIFFNGIFTPTQIGKDIVLVGPNYLATLAPALEYNFTANIGIIGGIWFPVAGKNTSKFTSYIISINAYW
jgi:hypothetical protein